MHRKSHSSRLVSFFLLSVLVAAVAQGASAPVSGYKVVAKYPHSVYNFTEGFFYRDGLFYEGTGLNGQSAVIVSEPQTGHQVRRIEVAAKYFGEGIVDWGPNLYEWTWETHVCFVYERSTLKLLRQLTYTGEGWGMTHDASRIITSDGTSTLRFRDPRTFQETRHIVVRDGSAEVVQLNELEYIKGEIYANVWHSDRIARISPRDGHVIGWIDLTGLLPADQRKGGEAVLNGIAYDSQHDRLFVTGKDWPTIFEIKAASSSK